MEVWICLFGVFEAKTEPGTKSTGKAAPAGKAATSSKATGTSKASASKANTTAKPADPASK